MNTFLKGLGLLALTLATFSPVQAIPLSTLLNGGSITAGDKLFSEWEFLFYDAFDGRTFNPTNIEVTALNDGGLDPGPGLQFEVLNDEFSVTGNGIYAYLNFMFGFQVTVLDPNLHIKDNSLEISNASAGNNDSGSYILETLSTAPGLDNLGIQDVEFSVLDGVVTSDPSDSVTFAPQSEIWVTKNILVWASDTDETANLQGFSQRFSQTTVPEPGTLGLLALGCAGLICLGKKRGCY